MGSGASNIFSENPQKRKLSTGNIPSFKIVLVGDSNVGKSSIFLRYTKEQFDYSYQPTMNVNICNVTKKVQLPYETLVTITLWDLPGREEIDLRRSYYKDIDAAIVVVDLSDTGSIQMAGTWKQDIYNNSFYCDTTQQETKRERKKSFKSQVQVPVLLVGNKIDKISKDDEDSIEEPPELKMLEQTALHHNFVGSVAVCAKESDGGVHTAIRSLMRYLLEKNMPNKRAKKEVKENANLKNIFCDPVKRNRFVRNLSNIDDHTYEPMKRCNIPEIDKIYSDCDKCVRSVETYCVAFLIAEKNFKRSCSVSGVSDTCKASMEECITGLKDALRNIKGGDEQSLIGIEEPGYIKLEVNQKIEDIPGPIRRCLDIYENEVCKTTKRILKHSGSLKANLNDHLKALNEIKDTVDTRINELGFSKKQMKISKHFIEINFVRINDTIELLDETLKISDDQFKKIKNAIMW